jgi:Protein of unknown function (DUF2752)
MSLKDSSATLITQRAFGLKMPRATEWWQSVRWVLVVFTVLVTMTLIGSFVSYERVISSGHPWLPQHHCPGCLFCGMTRSFCAMSNGNWTQAREWNKGGPALYTFFWIWTVTAFAYSGFVTQRFAGRQVQS